MGSVSDLVGATPHQPDVDDSTLGLLAQALVLIRQISTPANAAIALACGWDNPSNSSVVVLCRLAGDDGLRPRDLTAPTGLTTGGLSNLIGRLERSGLVERRHTIDPGVDRRSVTITLTPRGREIESTLCTAVAASLTSTSGIVRALISTLESADVVGAEPEPAEAIGGARRVILALAEAGLRLESSLLELETDSLRFDMNAIVGLAASRVEGSCRPRRLSQLLGITSGGASRLIDRLEEHGLVERFVDPATPDARSVAIRLTRDGRVRLDRSLVAGWASLGHVLAAMRLVEAGVHRAES